METNDSTEKEPESTSGLTPEKREDLWALIIAGIVLLACLAAPDAIHHFEQAVATGVYHTSDYCWAKAYLSRSQENDSVVPVE